MSEHVSQQSTLLSHNKTYSAHQIQSRSLLPLPLPLPLLLARQSLHHPPTDRHAMDQGSSPVSHPVQSSPPMTTAYLPQTSGSHSAVGDRKWEFQLEGFCIKVDTDTGTWGCRFRKYRRWFCVFVWVHTPAVLQQLTELGPAKRSVLLR